MKKRNRGRFALKVILLFLQSYLGEHLTLAGFARPAEAVTIPAPVTKDTESGPGITKTGEHPAPITFTIADDADIVFGDSSSQPYTQIETPIPNGAGIAAHEGAQLTVNKGAKLTITSQAGVTKGTLVKGLLAHAAAGENSLLSVNAPLKLNLETGNRQASGSQDTNNPKINGAGFYSLAEDGTATLKVTGDVALDIANEANRGGTFDPDQWLSSNSLTVGLGIVASAAGVPGAAPSPAATASMTIEGDANVTVRSVLNLRPDQVGSQSYISRYAAGLWMTNSRGNENAPSTHSSLHVKGDLKLHTVAKGGSRDIWGVYIDNNIGPFVPHQNQNETTLTVDGTTRIDYSSADGENDGQRPTNVIGLYINDKGGSSTTAAFKGDVSFAPADDDPNHAKGQMAGMRLFSYYGSDEHRTKQHLTFEKNLSLKTRSSTSYASGIWINTDGNSETLFNVKGNFASVSESSRDPRNSYGLWLLARDADTTLPVIDVTVGGNLELRTQKGAALRQEVAATGTMVAKRGGRIGLTVGTPEVPAEKAEFITEESMWYVGRAVDLSVGRNGNGGNAPTSLTLDVNAKQSTLSAKGAAALYLGALANSQVKASFNGKAALSASPNKESVKQFFDQYVGDSSDETLERYGVLNRNAVLYLETEDDGTAKALFSGGDLSIVHGEGALEKAVYAGGTGASVRVDNDGFSTTILGQTIADEQGRIDLKNVISQEGDIFAWQGGKIDIVTRPGAAVTGNLWAYGIGRPFNERSPRELPDEEDWRSSIVLEAAVGTAVTGSAWYHNPYYDMYNDFLTNFDFNNGEYDFDGWTLEDTKARNSWFHYDERAGRIDVSLGDGAVWNVRDVKLKARSGDFVTVASRGGERDAGEDLVFPSEVTSLHLNGGIVNLRGSADPADPFFRDPASAPDAFKGMKTSLNVAHLTGSGTFRMKGDIAAGSGSLLHIWESSEGAHKIDFANNGAAAGPYKPLKIVHSENLPEPPEPQPTVNARADLRGGEGETPDPFNATFRETHDVELGAFIYRVGNSETVAASALRESAYPDFVDTNADDWYLYPVKVPQPEPGPKPQPKITTTAEGAFTISATEYLAGRLELQTLNQRMGELRLSHHPSDGENWFRFARSRYKADAAPKFSALDADAWTFQFGHDWHSARPNGSHSWWGLMAGFSGVDTDIGSGDGRLKGRHLGLYGVWQNAAGFYLDGLVKWNWNDGSYHVTDTAGMPVDVDSANSRSVTASIEAGQRFYRDPLVKQGWYVEPQVQLSWTRLHGWQATASNGLNIDVQNHDSLILRAGANVGFDATALVKPWNAYLKVMYEKELKGDITVLFNGEPVSDDYGDDWLTVGLGAATRWSDHAQGWLEVQRSWNARFQQQWQVTAGVRFDL